VSAGCKNCYAAAFAHRFDKPGGRYEGLTRMTPDGPKWVGEARPIHGMLHRPMEWKKPCKVFVNSMSDLFHPDVPYEFIAAVFGIMAVCRQHIFQVLTKRPDRMKEWFEWAENDMQGRHKVPSIAHHAACIVDSYSRKHSDRINKAINRMGFGYLSKGWPLPHVWLGVSVEDDSTMDRVETLLTVPAAVHWVSFEPLLGAILIPDEYLNGEYAPRDHGGVMAEELGPKLGWVVVGGESGHKGRPMSLNWVRTLRDQCQHAGIPFLFKQWGEWKPHVGVEEVAENVTVDMPLPTAQPYGKNTFIKANGKKYEFYGGGLHWMRRTGKKAAGRELDGRIWDEYPCR